MKEEIEEAHRSGFVNIIGRPNVGKSTLMNALVGERMSIITHKPQTTRHRILGIVSAPSYQIVFSDTPGFIRKPSYKMHNAMNQFVRSTFEDADVMLFVTEPNERYEENDELFEKLEKIQVPLLLVVNKIDLIDQSTLSGIFEIWRSRIPTFTDEIGISALKKFNTDPLLQKILTFLPQGPAYYPPDQLTDRPERFFIAEIIREKIFLNYRDEIPYSCEVLIESFKETQTNGGLDLTRIEALIFVARETQKSIVLGKDGAAIKKLGSDARKEMEEYLQTKVFLEMTVKVRDNWRDDENQLKKMGYTL